MALRRPGDRESTSGRQPPFVDVGEHDPEEHIMSRLTRYISMLAITVGATLVAAIPASAMPLPPPDNGAALTAPVGTVVLRTGWPTEHVALVAICSSLLTIAVVLTASWVRSREPGRMAHAG
jgi:hypothetical protein